MLCSTTLKFGFERLNCSEGEEAQLADDLYWCTLRRGEWTSTTDERGRRGLHSRRQCLKEAKCIEIILNAAEH